MSFVKLVNECKNYEKNSNKFIKSSCYFIVCIKFKSEIKLDKLKQVANSLFDNNIINDAPLIIYSALNSIFILFSNDEDYNDNKCHQNICSEYASFISLLTNIAVSVNIVELTTRMKTITYFYMKVFSNICKILNSDEHNYLQDSIKKFGEEKWNSIPDNIKFGVFYKKKDNSSVIEELSEQFDVSTLDKYENFFFR